MPSTLRFPPPLVEPCLEAVVCVDELSRALLARPPTPGIGDGSGVTRSGQVHGIPSGGRRYLPRHRGAVGHGPWTLNGSSVRPVGPISIAVPIWGQTPQSKHGLQRQSSTSCSSRAACQSSQSQSRSSPESM